MEEATPISFKNLHSREYPGHKKKVHSVAWNCTVTKLAFGSVDQTARIWHIEPHGHGKVKEIELKGHTDIVDQLCWDPKHADLIAPPFLPRQRSSVIGSPTVPVQVIAILLIFIVCARVLLPSSVMAPTGSIQLGSSPSSICQKTKREEIHSSSASNHLPNSSERRISQSPPPDPHEIASSQGS